MGFSLVKIVFTLECHDFTKALCVWHQRWEYNHTPEPGSREAAIMEVLKNPKDWV